MVYDSDFDVPLAEAKVLIAETSETVVTTAEGNYIFGQVESGTYTLVFSKEGYTRQVKADVVVAPGQMTEVDSSLSGEFEEMEEFVVQDVQIGTGTEAALLDLRMESPALMDSISADLMSQAGAGDAAAALNLVSGATVQDGKFAVIRGLPDRYVNSQMNGVRLPTADADKRAVQLDQFPSAVIESIQVSKTFTPDQQGDASGGAVNVVLKGIPDETVLKFDTGYSYNTQVKDAGDRFLTYKGGGVNFWGMDDREIPSDNRFDPTAGISYGNAPVDYKWSLAGGGKHEFEDGLKIGGFGSFFYELDSSFYDNGVDDKYWVEGVGNPMTPQYSGDPDQDPETGQTIGDFTTSLFDVTQSSQQVQWGGLGILGMEYEEHSLNLLYMHTHSAEDKVTLAEDTRGKAYYFPDYDIDDPTDPGNSQDGQFAAPYLRNETLEYTERTTQTLQLHGRHTLADLDWGIDTLFTLLSPELDWTLSTSSARLYQPDKRQFGSFWLAESYYAGFPPWVPPSTEPAVHGELAGTNVNLGNFQRIWKDINEDSDQYSLNLKLPFEQWSGDEGYLKFGLFHDKVSRTYEQDSFSNSDGDDDVYYDVWGNLWSRVFLSEGHEMFASPYDVDYEGEQEISAWYYMADLPLNSFFHIIGGARFEKTELGMINNPDRDEFGNITATWVEPGGTTQIAFDPDDTDVSFKQEDVLPSIGFVFTPLDQITLRGSYSETVARQTFKELSPIMQMEYLGGDVFSGNPGLKMSALKNYDLRFDYTPYEGSLISVSYFHKSIEDPIEYVKGYADFPYTYPVNYPEGELSGYEIEMRQQLGRLFESLDGMSLGANATFINSEVTLPESESELLSYVGAPMTKRDMTNAPEHLYNFFLTYELADLGTQLGLFYTVRGDTLVAGAGQSGGEFIPSVYDKEYGTLNLSVSQKLGETWKLKFQAKNLLNPEIEQVNRHHITGEERVKTSYTKGMDFSVSLSATF
jgi:outer membrane receptor protein involved in Fe transport